MIANPTTGFNEAEEGEDFIFTALGALVPDVKTAAWLGEVSIETAGRHHLDDFELWWSKRKDYLRSSLDTHYWARRAWSECQRQTLKEPLTAPEKPTKCISCDSTDLKIEIRKGFPDQVTCNSCSSTWPLNVS